MNTVRTTEYAAAVDLQIDLSENDLKKALLHLLEKRWSPRGFSDEPLTPETITSIFDAGRQVPSSYNEQPWRFIITDKGTAAHAKLFEALDQTNKKWVHTAPHLGIVLGKKHFSHKDIVNPHRFYDCGAFMAIASLYAATMDIYLHQMAGFSNQKLREELDFPEDFSAITMFVLGKIGDAEQLPEPLKEKEDQQSERNAVFTFLFNDKWGAPY